MPRARTVDGTETTTRTIRLPCWAVARIDAEDARKAGVTPSEWMRDAIIMRLKCGHTEAELDAMEAGRGEH